MSYYYLDTSAAIKLLSEDEEHAIDFATFYDNQTSASWVSSTLLKIELMRAVSRSLPALIPDARDLLAAFDYVHINDDIVDRAINEPDQLLRPLDAIHLATARVLRSELDGIITYDKRFAMAAHDAGFTVFSPGSDVNP